MTRPASFPFPRALKMPLRDVYRGLASFAEMTDEALEPLKDGLPEPVRSTLGHALRKAEGLGSELFGPHVSHDDIRRAAAFMQGTSYDTQDIQTCAIVLAFAWNKFLSAENLQPLLSETLVSVRLSLFKDTENGTPGLHAAQVIAVLRDSHLAGGLPGMSAHLSDAQQADVDLRLVATAVWLLAARANTLEEELRLPEMALALCSAYGSDILSNMDDSAELASVIQSLSEHL